jgi:hypothetical protein
MAFATSSKDVSAVQQNGFGVMISLTSTVTSVSIFLPY